MSGTAILEAPPAEALTLRESISLAEGIAGQSVFDEDGCVPIHIIRPGVGKGRGRHLYEADMLEANADVFSGWKMYVDHESPQARKAAGGLPRKTRDLGGRIVEAKWDPTVPADPERGFGAGAVVGRARPVKWIRELIEDDPALLEASISASATAVRPIVRDGLRVWLVEGIDNRGTVDWVTEAGAGGRVAALLEAMTDEEESDVALLESMSDNDLQTYLAENRPEIKLAEAGEQTPITPEEGDMADITPEALQEALVENPEVLVKALAQSAESQLFVSTLVEAKLDEERDIIRAEAKADAQRQIDLRDLRDAAHAQIEESASRLPESWRKDLKAKFTLSEGTATPALDVVDDVDDDGAVTKPAAEKLREAVEAEVKRESDRLAEIRPTRVRDQGPKPEGNKPEGELKEGDEKPAGAEKTGWGQFLQEAGIDPNEAYA